MISNSSLNSPYFNFWPLSESSSNIPLLSNIISMLALFAGADTNVILVPAWSVVNPVVLAISEPLTKTCTFLGSKPNVTPLSSKPENTVSVPSPVNGCIPGSVAVSNSMFPSVTSMKASAPEPSVPVLINTSWSLTVYPDPTSSTLHN